MNTVSKVKFSDYESSITKALDAVAGELLGHKAKRIQYLTLANGLLGSLDNIRIVQDENSGK